MSDREPTQKQLEALCSLAEGPQGSWRYASTTVHVLTLQGWARREHHRDARGASTSLVLTDAGRAAALMAVEAKCRGGLKLTPAEVALLPDEVEHG